MHYSEKRRAKRAGEWESNPGFVNFIRQAPKNVTKAPPAALVAFVAPSLLHVWQQVSGAAGSRRTETGTCRSTRETNPRPVFDETRPQRNPEVKEHKDRLWNKDRHRSSGLIQQRQVIRVHFLFNFISARKLKLFITKTRQALFEFLFSVFSVVQSERLQQCLALGPKLRSDKKRYGHLFCHLLHLFQQLQHLICASSNWAFVYVFISQTVRVDLDVI